MKKKQRIDLVHGLLLMLYSIIVVVLPTFGYTNIKVVYLTTFIVYAVVNTYRFIALRKTKDYEGLFYVLSSIAGIFLTLTCKELTPQNLSLILFFWVALNSLSKLKKADYYNDRRDRMWKYGLLDLAIFLFTGMLACINLSYSGDVQILVMGFFLLVNSILEVFDPVIKTLIARS